MWQYTYSDELYHYGVLGMKWGVRRFQPYPKGKHGTFLGQDRDDDIVIKKGTESYRVQSSGDVQNGGQTYVSFDKVEHIGYLGIVSGMGKSGGVALDCTIDNGNDGRPYSVRMELQKDLIAPSYSKTMDAYFDTMGSMGAKDFAKNFTGSNREARQLVKNYRNRNADELVDESYRKFVGTFMNDSKAKRIFFENLQANGYNALIDDWDKGFGSSQTYTTPTIVFDTKDTFKKKESVPISKEDAEYFRELFWSGGSPGAGMKDQHEKWQDWAGKYEAI